MKFSILLMSLIGLMLLSCRKTLSDTVPTSLDGTWKMIIVKENATSASITKPSSILADVIITFVPKSSTTGTFSGKTPSNDLTGFGIWSNAYTVGPNQTISIPNLSMTKVGETSWGSQFVDNIRDAQQYSFETGGKLNIMTVNKTLTFQKL
ncbi:MAG: hypothetical protein WKG06_46870 [Segetibacter sp.]